MTSPRVPRHVALVMTVTALVASLLTSVLWLSSEAEAADMSKFRAGNIISDAMFFNSGAMDEADIQRFLDAEGKKCTVALCLKRYTATMPTKSADSFCRGYAASGVESAARIIDKVAKSCGINPQVILVTLQKEQGLVTRTDPTVARYQKAMGMGCPDYQACNPAYHGFANQVYDAARRFQQYVAPGSTFRYKAGTYNTIQFYPDKPGDVPCGATSVFIQNKATAALYNYTPYQPNAAALAAGAGTGDRCSTYGNRNFYRYFSDWFGNPTNDRFTDVPTWHAFNDQMTWLADQNITTGYTDGSFRPAQPVLREQMAAFLYRFAYSGQNPSSVEEVSGFRDVPSTHAFTRHIQWLANRAITTGYTDNTYRPAQPVLREQMAAFLYRLAGRPAYTPPSTSPFRDVSTRHTFYKEICWLASKGVSEGYSDGTFRPQQPVLREQMAAFLFRMADKELAVRE